MFCCLSFNQPPDLQALSYGLECLQRDFEYKALGKNPDTWLEKIEKAEQTKIVMNRILTADMDDDLYGGLPGKCR